MKIRQPTFGRALTIIIGTMLLWAASANSVFAYNYGDRVQCTVNLNVRATASTSGTLITTETSGSKGTIESGTSQSANGYTWWYITWDNSYTGWSVDSLQLVPVPPTATTVAATLVTSTGATLNSTVNPNGLSTTIYFQYGLTTGYGSSTTSGSIGTSSGNYGTAITGLSPNTTYHFRIVATSTGGTTDGSDLTFTTPPNATPPTATTVAATLITTTGATLNSTVNANGLSTTIYFQYGLTTSYGSTTISGNIGTTSGNYALAITGLSPNTTYHFRIVATSSGGTTDGNDLTFATSGTGSPTVQSLDATSVTTSSAQLNGSVNPNGLSTTAHFEYGLTAAYGSSTASGNFGTTSQNIGYTISGLIPNTTYHFRLDASNTSGPSYGVDKTFTTLPPPPRLKMPGFPAQAAWDCASARLRAFPGTSCSSCPKGPR